MAEITYRIETDFLGDKQLPKDAYYGIQTQRAYENFPMTGTRVDIYVIEGLGYVKQAAAQANMQIGQLDETRAEAIIRASKEVIDGKLNDHFILDPIQGGAGTSSNMNANEVIANRALELLGHHIGEYHEVSPNTHVNMCQSTNDVFPTANRIGLLKRLDELDVEMNLLHDAFIKKSEAFYPYLKMGRTHLQDAVPLRLGQSFEAYAGVFARDMTRIKSAREGLYAINMGGTAVGTGLNANPVYIESVTKNLRENTGYPLYTAENLIDATQHTDAYTTLSAMLKITMTNISKVANDLRLMTSGPKVGLGEITLPTRQAGSSIMPGKINPVIAEVVNQVAFQVMGNDQTVTQASEAGQFELNVMEPVLVHNVLESIKLMTNVFRVFREECIEGIEVNAEQLEENMQKSLGVITAINPHIGYESATMIADEAFKTGKPIRDIVLAKGLLTEEVLDQILDPAEMTKPGIAASHLLDK